MSSTALGRTARVVGAWSPEERDAVLYAASALFAICTAQASSITLYQQWGRLAVGPYAAGAVASAVAARRHRARVVSSPDPESQDFGAPSSASELSLAERQDDGHRPVTPAWHWTTPRAAIFLLVLVGSTLMPLSLEVLWRTDTGGTAHVQPEVRVVEQAGENLARHRPLYRVVENSRGQLTEKPPPGQPVYDLYNPYLPLMAFLGLPSSTHAPHRLTDARVTFSLVTIVLVVVALAMCRGPTGPRVLALQSMTVLPTAALPLATGGDDLPVAALMLLGLVLMQRRRPFAAGLTLGVAASMKITAWPLAALAFLAARDKRGNTGRRPALWLVGGLAAVMIPAIVPTAASNFPAFFDNVVRFPLGLAGISSPAASPLLGHAIVSLFPHIHRLFTAAVVAVGGVVLVSVLVLRPPRTAAALARLVGWAMAVAILLAPATRIGYLLYPLNLLIWSWLLQGEADAEAAQMDADVPSRLIRGDDSGGTDEVEGPVAWEQDEERERIPVSVGAHPGSGLAEGGEEQ